MLATGDGRFSLDDPRLIRAVTFLQNGQRFEGWLPVGSYEIHGEVDLPLGRGSSEVVRAVKVRQKINGTFWYIGLEVAQKLGVVK